MTSTDNRAISGNVAASEDAVLQGGGIAAVEELPAQANDAAEAVEGAAAKANDAAEVVESAAAETGENAEAAEGATAQVAGGSMAKNAPTTDLPLVSVLVLTYNNVDGIYPTLDSLFAQSYPRIQLVISDDASRDFAEQRVAVETYIAQHAGPNIEDTAINAIPRNVGTVKNTNSALSLANGAYVICLAAEDMLIRQDTIATYVRFMESHPECDVCFGKLRGVMPDGGYKYELLSCDTDYDKLRGFNRQQTLNHLFRRNFLPAPAGFIRMDAYVKYGLHDEEMRLIEDYPFWIKVILKGGKFGYIDDYTVDYLLTGVSSAGEYGEQFMRDLMAIYDKYIFPNDRRFNKLQGPYNALKRWGLAFYLSKAQWSEYGALRKAGKAVFYSPLFAFTWAQRALNDLKNKRISG